MMVMKEDGVEYLVTVVCETLNKILTVFTELQATDVWFHMGWCLIWKLSVRKT